METSVEYIKSFKKICVKFGGKEYYMSLEDAIRVKWSLEYAIKAAIDKGQSK